MDPRVLVPVVEQAFDAADLDAHVAAVALRPARRFAALSVWNAPIAALLRLPAPSQVTTPRDTALLGARLALMDAPPGAAVTAFAQACARELAREPMPPAACVWDEERFLIGIAAGVGVVAKGMAAGLIQRLHSRAAHIGLRQRVIDLWAENLARGSHAIDPESAPAGFRLLTSRDAAEAVRGDDDRIAALWLASQLLDTFWQPTGDQIAAILEVLETCRRSLAMTVARDTVSAVDCALLLTAGARAPSQSVQRHGTVERLLAIIEHFPASAHVVANRQRNRAPFTMSDEYDVQDLFRALVLHVVPDLVPEDPAAKIALHGSRLDFVSQHARLGIELKHLKSRGDLDRVRDDILIDEATYHVHPYVENVIVFVHDPLRFLALPDRAAFEADLSKTIAISGRPITYITRVR